MLLASILAFLEGLEGLMLIFFLLGIILIVIEILMPGFGLSGTLGIISLIVGVFLASKVVSTQMLIFIIVLVLLAIAGTLVWLYRSVTRDGRVSRLLTLRTKTGKEEGYSSSDNYSQLIGAEGIALTPLRPSGIGEFNGKKLDVVTDGNYITKDSKIKIVDVEGFKIIVTKIE